MNAHSSPKIWPNLLTQAAAVAVLILFLSPAARATLLSHYTLDNTTADSGSLDLDGTLVGSAAFTSNNGDSPFAYSLSIGSASGYLSASTASNAAYTFTSITLTMWVNVAAASAPSTIDRLISNLSTSAGFDLSINNFNSTNGTFTLQFGANGTSGTNFTANSTTYSTDTWLFIAVTYDSASQTLSFYSGDTASDVSLDATLTKTGSIAMSASNLRIGSTPASTGDRTPTALLNDVRVYNTTLSSSELETVRASAIPEPAAASILIGGLSLLWCTARRKRRN